MKRLLLLFALSSCVSQNYITKEDEDRIPRYADVIEVTEPINPDELYKKAYEALLEQGLRIQSSDKEMHTITTEGGDIGQSTLARYNLFVKKKDETSSILIMRCDWLPGTDAKLMSSALSGLNVSAEWERATYDQSGRPRLAFAHGVDIAKKISKNISYREGKAKPTKRDNDDLYN